MTRINAILIIESTIATFFSDAEMSVYYADR